METGVESLARWKELLGLQAVEAAQYSPLVLAYIGDCVYELVVRTVVVNEGNVQVNKMHKKSAELVKAGTQSRMVRLLEPELLPEEMAVFKRGRNAKSATMAKHATMSDYRRATGFEALVGYLYLTEQFDRLVELVSRGFLLLKEEESGGEKTTGGTEKVHEGA